jgi:hypothetical protein
MPKTGAGEDAIQIAHKLIRNYGLRAAAVAQEHLSELRVQGDTTGLEKWRQVQLAIADFRSTKPQGPLSSERKEGSAAVPRQ